MKIQHLAVIFIIIIMPISLVFSEYLHLHIQTIENQTQYTTNLINATYDMSQAFQTNTANNRFSTLSDSKIRDITASVNTFYTTLGTSMGGYTSEEMKDYTPAILCTLYDGYYVYTSYYDTVTNDYTYGLKPFCSYSCRYKKGNDYDFVVNYTLDNTITIIGTVNRQYVTKTGHLININTADSLKDLMKSENLSENLIILNEDGTFEKKSFEYVIYNNQKAYKENDNTFFYYSTENKKDYINDSEIKPIIKDMFDKGGSSSAINYYTEAIEFTKWVNTNLGSIEASDAADADGNKITDFATDLGDAEIFNTTGNDNNPLLSSSDFNENRMNVIRKSIETNLVPAIATYNRHSSSGYEFAMPKIGEADWSKIENNVCFVSFMQGLPIGNKTYNNYVVVANDTNKEAVGEDSIYIITSDGEYHKPGCKKLIEELNKGTVTIIGAYASSDFVRQAISLTGDISNAAKQLDDSDSGTSSNSTAYYYPQCYTACYDCIVNIADTYSTDDIISKDGIGNSTTDKNGVNLRLFYLQALARCRYDLYTVNGYFGS